jgi:adenylate cyclase
MTFCSTFLAIAWFYAEARQILFSELRSKVLTAATTAANSLDGDAIAKIQSPEDMDTPGFQKIAKEFLAIRNANRRNDIYVKYIYTLRANPQNPAQLQIGIEATDADLDRYAFTGENNPEGIQYGFLANLHNDWASPELVTDRWGRFLTGLSPIYDSQGRYVATLGIDLSSDSVIHELRRLQMLAAITLGITLGIAFLAAMFVTRAMTRSFEQITEGVHQIEHGDLKTRINLPTHDEFSNLADAINHMAKGLEEHERVKLNFVRYVSKHVLEKILASDMAPALKGERRKITVLFSDIREFTHLAEKLPPEDVVSLLNEYLEEMLHVIFEHNGTLDKFIGDGLMVEFGAPLEDPTQEKHALQTAVAMQEALKKLNEGWAKQGRPNLRMGIGIHTGFAIVGNIGSEKRMEYTAIGDTVNVASRLEHATKNYQTEILISESTLQGMENTYPVKLIGPIALPGRTEPIVAYSLDL